MRATTDVGVRVLVTATATCPKCAKRIQLDRELSEDALVTGNTAQAAVYHLREMRRAVNEAMVMRGWTVAMCGTCRDVAP